MIIIGKTVVEADVGDARFACDLDACRGACCCLPGARGAPLEDDEVLEIGKAMTAIRSILSPASLAAIEALGPVEGRAGDFATQCIEGGDCVFVYRDNTVAKCALERAYLDGRTDWRKPLSCHLFPIRIRPSDRDVLRYEQIPECRGGRTRGSQENIPLVAYVGEALERKYGEGWYEQLRERCASPG